MSGLCLNFHSHNRSSFTYTQAQLVVYWATRKPRLTDTTCSRSIVPTTRGMVPLSVQLQASTTCMTHCMATTLGSRASFASSGLCTEQQMPLPARTIGHLSLRYRVASILLHSPILTKPQERWYTRCGMTEYTYLTLPMVLGRSCLAATPVA